MKNRMESVSVRTGVLCLSVLALSGTPAAGQSVSGTVVGENGAPLRGVVVAFLGGTNAELISTTTTDFNGAYNSAVIPPGSYRVRFSASSHYPAFFGAAGDDYCSGAPVTVAPDATTSGVNHALQPLEPSKTPLNSGDIGGLVVDASTGAPLAGIAVTVFDAFNAQILLQAVTGADGEYLVPFSNASYAFGRVRFSSPENRYFPQFYGAGGADDFCLARAVDLVDKERADASLQPIPGQQAENLLDQVEELGLPENVGTALAAPLVQAATLLTDGNAANDQGVCGQLTAFMARVDMQERRGQLSPIEASSLRDAAQALKAAMGCQ